MYKTSSCSARSYLHSFVLYPERDEGGAIAEQVKIHAGPSNLITILGTALVVAIKTNNRMAACECYYSILHSLQRRDAMTDSAVTVINLLTNALKAELEAKQQNDTGSSSSDSKLAPEYEKLARTTKRIWRPVLGNLQSTSVKDPEDNLQLEIKDCLLQIWIALGAVLGLETPPDASLSQEPSLPSEEILYWKIPKRCFWNMCGCADESRARLHAFRVCTGCYRVLYCSTRCQSA